MWLILIIGFLFALFIILKIRRWRRLIYPTLEIVDLGNGKMGFNKIKSGWLGSKLYLKGLWWSGEEVLRTQYNDRINYFSTEDFQEVDGKRGVVCYRNPTRQDILVPINHLGVKGKELISAIAPADYTDVAIDIINESVKETSEFRDKLIQFGGWALIVIFSLVTIIIIVQMVKSGQEKSAELLLSAGTKGAEACKSICSDAANIAVSRVTGAP